MVNWECGPNHRLIGCQHIGKLLKTILRVQNMTDARNGSSNLKSFAGTDFGITKKLGDGKNSSTSSMRGVNSMPEMNSCYSEVKEEFCSVLLELSKLMELQLKHPDFLNQCAGNNTAWESVIAMLEEFNRELFLDLELINRGETPKKPFTQWKEQFSLLVKRYKGIELTTAIHKQREPLINQLNAIFEKISDMAAKNGFYSRAKRSI